LRPDHLSILIILIILIIYTS